MLFMQYIQLFLTIYKFNYFYRFFSKNELSMIFSHKNFLAKERNAEKRIIWIEATNKSYSIN